MKRKWMIVLFVLVLFLGGAGAGLMSLNTAQAQNIDVSLVFDNAREAASRVQSYRLNDDAQLLELKTGRLIDSNVDAICIVPNSWRVMTSDEWGRREIIVHDGKMYGNKNGETQIWNVGDWHSIYGDAKPCLAPGVNLKATETIEVLPDDIIEGVTCFHFRDKVNWETSMSKLMSEVESDPDLRWRIDWLRILASNSEVTCDIWIGKDDYLLRKVSLNTKLSDNINWEGYLEDDGVILISSKTIEIFDYDKESNIVQPPLIGGNTTFDWCPASYLCDDVETPFGWFCYQSWPGLNICYGGPCFVDGQHHPELCNPWPCFCQSGMYPPLCGICRVGWCYCRTVDISRGLPDVSSEILRLDK